MGRVASPWGLRNRWDSRPFARLAVEEGRLESSRRFWSNSLPTLVGLEGDPGVGALSDGREATAEIGPLGPEPVGELASEQRKMTSEPISPGGRIGFEAEKNDERTVFTHGRIGFEQRKMTSEPISPGGRIGFGAEKNDERTHFTRWANWLRSREK